MKTKFEQFVEFAEKKYGLTIVKTDRKEDVLTAREIFGPLLDILDDCKDVDSLSSLNDEYKPQLFNSNNDCSFSYKEIMQEKTASVFLETKYSCLAV